MRGGKRGRRAEPDSRYWSGFSLLGFSGFLGSLADKHVFHKTGDFGGIDFSKLGGGAGLPGGGLDEEEEEDSDDDMPALEGEEDEATAKSGDAAAAPKVYDEKEIA